MLRFLYTITGLIAGLCAVVSPIAIFHWLFSAIQVSGTESAVAMLNPLFAPLNSLLEFFIKPPPLQFQGQSVPTTQGVLGVVMTGGFFAFHFMTESLKAAEQRLDVTRQSLQQRLRLQQLKSQENKQLQAAALNRRILVSIRYDFGACPTGGACFETSYAPFGGNALEMLPDCLTLEFNSLEQAFKYCLDAMQGILGHYATLRPMDPQPPFHVGVHAVPVELPVPEGVSRARRLNAFAGGNQVIFSQDAKAVLESQGLGMTYHYQSQGVYAIDESRGQEVFRLFYRKRDGAF